jgi:hypothetical protein
MPASRLPELMAGCQKRDVRCGFERKMPGQAGIVGHLYGPPVRYEAGADIERQGGGVVQGTGVDEKAADRFSERAPDRFVHQDSTGSPTDRVRHDS